MIRAWFMLVALLAAAAPGLASDAPSPGRLSAASGGDHGWVVAEQRWTDTETWDLYHTAAGDPVGTLSRVMMLSERPVRLIGDDRRLLMIFAARPGAGKEALRPVRSVSAVISGVGGIWLYIPQGRAQAEPPLPGSGVLVGAGRSPRGPAVLIRERSDRGPGRLLVLENGDWTHVPLPEAASEDAAWSLLAIAGGVEFAAGQRSWRWTDDQGWRDAPARAPTAGARVFAAGTQTVEAEWAQGTGLKLRLDSQGGPVGLATLAAVPEDAAVLAAGDSVSAYWFDETETHRLRCVSVSAITGETLFDGLVGAPSPLRPQDFQLLTLVAVSVVLMVVLFLIRPEGDTSAEPVLPEGTALAEPAARLIAAVIDALPAALVSAWVWGVPLSAALSPMLAIEASDGLAPILTTGALYFAHSCVSEWLAGRTLGKRLTGCQTADITGRPGLTLRQALIRNLFKAAFPPLTVLLLIDPARRHPADQVAGTVVVGTARTTEDEPPPGE